VLREGVEILKEAGDDLHQADDRGHAFTTNGLGVARQG